MSTTTLMWMFGAITMLAFVSGLFFLQFAIVQRERFFVWFAVAFWLLGLSWLLPLFTGPNEEMPYIYLFRAAAYLTIVVAIIDRNRRPREKGIESE